MSHIERCSVQKECVYVEMKVRKSGKEDPRQFINGKCNPFSHLYLLWNDVGGFSNWIEFPPFYILLFHPSPSTFFHHIIPTESVFLSLFTHLLCNFDISIKQIIQQTSCACLAKYCKNVCVQRTHYSSHLEWSLLCCRTFTQYHMFDEYFGVHIFGFAIFFSSFW